MTVYVAPARFLLTELHRPENGWEVDVAAGATASTRCGLPMLEDELWRPVGKQDGDRECRACAGTAENGTEEGLW